MTVLYVRQVLPRSESKHPRPVIGRANAHGGATAMTQQSVRRKQVITLILSGVFPGLGQFYNRQPGKGAAFLAAGVALTWLLGRAVPTELLLIQPDARLIVPLCILLIVWLWSIIDAWRVAAR